MEALKVKYEQNKAEVLRRLDVSKELLDVLTKNGVLDEAESLKYQGVPDSRKKAGWLMQTMVERRTERAYPLFLQCLRQAGQDGVASLLTDVGEETRLLAQLQGDLEHEIAAISAYIGMEERRTGLVAATASHGPWGGGDDGALDQLSACAVPASDKELWLGVQATLKRASAQFERCRAVISKLHRDCEDMARANGDMVTQIRNCYSRVKALLKPGLISAHTGEVPKSTQVMFQSLIEDVEKLMDSKSQAQREENEGRTTAMRTLRHLRDWIEERSSILDTLHTSTSSTPRPRRLPLLTSRRDTAASLGVFGAAAPLPTSARPSHSRQQTPSPPRSTSTANSYDESPATLAVDLALQVQDQGERASLAPPTAEHLGTRQVELHAINTVLEGLQLLEQQVRRYVHMEILLTDKYRGELRYKHLRKKSQGLTSQGLEEAKRVLDRLEACSHDLHRNHPNLLHTNTSLGSGPGHVGLTPTVGQEERTQWVKLRAALDAVSDEYHVCAAYLGRMEESFAKVSEVDGWVTDPEDDAPGKKKKGEKERRNKHRGDNSEKPSLFSFFSRLTGQSSKATKEPSSTTLPQIATSASHPRGGQQPPHHHDHHHHQALGGPEAQTGAAGPRDPPLLALIKQLVTSFDTLRNRLQHLQDKYRLKYEHKRRWFMASLKVKEEEITRLQLRLRETEAEKEKYRGLYEKMKVTYAKRR